MLLDLADFLTRRVYENFGWPQGMSMGAFYSNPMARCVMRYVGPKTLYLVQILLSGAVLVNMLACFW